MTTIGALAAAAAVLATVLGGALAFRFRARLPRVAAFGAGSLVAVALLDLIPEAVELTGEPSPALLAAAAGFLVFYLLERLALFHAHPEEHAPAGHAHVGVLGAAGVSLQSLVDGLALGLAFAADPDVGFVVTLAVMLHKLTDGTSTVTLILTSGHGEREAVTWLTLASVAPLIGFGLSALIAPPQAVLGVLLGGFAGTFLYLGASHLLPEAHQAEAGRGVAVATLLGFAFVFAAGSLLGGV